MSGQDTGVMAKKILIIDDEPDTRELLQNRLVESGYEAYEASGPAAGFKLIQTHQPDLIILDVLMPEMTGYEFIQALKKMDKSIRDIPVIVISGRQSMQDFFNSWEVFGFIPKPFDASKLLDMVDQAVRAPGDRTGTPDENARTGETAGRGKVVVAVSENHLGTRIQNVFTQNGFEVLVTHNGSDALEQASASGVQGVFVQFLENAEGLDADQMRKKLASSETTAKLPFTAFCRKELGVDAVRTFGHANIIVYDKSEELLGKIEHIIRTRLNT